MARTPAQLSVARNETAAVTVAAKILDALTGAQAASAVDSSALRLTLRHAEELLEMAGLPEQEVQAIRNAARANETAESVQLSDRLRRVEIEG